MATTMGTRVQPDLEKTVSRRSHSNVPPQELLANEADTELLATLGYKQELRRNFTMLEVFGIAFSIMGLLPSIASTLAFSIPAGPVGMVWGWFLASMFIFVVGVAMADLGSAMPTSGGLYWWTHYFASPKTRNALSFLVGYSNSLGLIGGLCSVDYGFALMFCSVIVIARDGNWTPSNGVVYAVFLCCVLLHGVLASTLSKVMGKLQTVFVAMNIILIIATIIALPVGKHLSSERNDAHYIFAQTENLTTWPTGWAFMLSWLSPIWTIGAFDSCVHMSEEAANAAKAVPYGIMMSIGCCWFLGFIIMIVIGACINPDLESVLGSSFGQPMAQIYYDAIGKSGTLGLMSLLFIVQFAMGLSILVAASRQTWAFSRDGALPFSSFFRPISKRMGYIPFRTIWGCVLLAAVLGLLCLIAPAAAAALFSLVVAGNNLAWGLPIFCRVVWGQHKFVPGPFYTGDYFSKPIAWVAIIFLVFGIVLAMFPVGGPNPTPQSMNYTVVINMAVWGGAVLYYFVDARKWFTGPKITIGVEGLTGEQQAALTAEGLDLGAVEGIVPGGGLTEPRVEGASEKVREKGDMDSS
ncbi:gaba permease [Hyaloscypha finlandica]|nr:gaba permease [Hyaloscypha finlandica]